MTEDTPDSAATRPLLGKAGKWIAAITAVLTLIFGLWQLSDRLFGVTSKRRHIRELLATARVQLEQHDYRAAWTSDSFAAVLAGDDRTVRRAQEDVAMAWLEESRLTEGESFAGLAGRLSPVLQRGLLDATGQRRADLLAHLGWAEFLRTRDGVFGRPPDSLYRQALGVDPQNVYAHTMLGHWELWGGGSLAVARDHFASALASGRVHGYVRRMQLASLENARNDEASEELIRVVNDMRVHGERVDERARSAIGGVYFFRATADAASLHRLLTAVPAADHLKTFQWLFGEDGGGSPVQRYMLGLLQEAAGERADALRTMQTIRQDPSLSPRIRTGVSAAIRRLGRPLPPPAQDTPPPR